MTTLPTIRTQRYTKPKVLTLKLDNLLHECDLLSESFSIQENINKDFGVFNEGLEQLKQSNETYTERIRPSKKIDMYVRNKFKSNEIPVREIMTTSKRSTHLSFEGYKDNELSKTLSKQKRKFGEFWKEVALSLDSQITERLPDLESATSNNNIGKIINKDKIARNHRLDNMIRTMVSKKLGLQSTVIPIQSRKKLKKRKPIAKALRRNSVDLDKIMLKTKISLDSKETLGENEYLKSEYTNLLNNATHRLKLEKILISQHQKDRKKQTMIPLMG